MAIVRPTVENMRALGDFTQVFRWHVNFSQIPSGVGGMNAEDINFRAESMAKPQKTSNAVEIQMRGNKIVRPGIGVYTHEFALTAISTIDAKVEQFMHDWQALCWESENGSTGIIRNYEELEGACTLTLLDNLDQGYWAYDLTGVWLKDGGGGDVDNANEEPHKPAMTFAYDYYTDGAL